ncbi:MAG: hypothetical protein JXR19_04660 [Bacteroidia bacterium]
MNNIGLEHIDELESLVSLSPWCSAYRTLLARAYKNANLPQFEQKLSLASLYAGNRAQLYKVLHESDLKLSEVSSDFVVEEEVVSDHKIDFDEIVTYDPSVELASEIKEEPKKEVEQSIPFEQILYNPEKELQKLAEEREEEAEHDFYYWLNHSREKEESNEKTSSVEQVNDLLEDFLASKKKPVREKREFYKAETKANESEVDDSQLVSETLAKLYVKQELYEKALDAYRKLSLQNPSKSAYFAARITDLERVIEQKEE